jgi:pimeloyl-ACP methyl ester carboxylesterase
MSTIILIPGVNPQAARGIFDAIRKVLHNEKFIELTAASEEQLLEKKPKEKFILIGKSMGCKVTLEHQLKHNDASALVLLAPAVEADERFGEIETKTLIIHGTADPVMSIGNSRKLAKIIPNCKLIEIEGADYSYRRHEMEAAEAIKKFMQVILK